MFAEYWLYMLVPLIFVAIVFWIYRPGAKKRYKADASIPFENDPNETQAQRRSHYPP